MHSIIQLSTSNPILFYSNGEFIEPTITAFLGVINTLIGTNLGGWGMMALALVMVYFAWYLKQIKRKWTNLLDISCKSRSFSLWVEKYARRFTDYVDQIVPEAMVSAIAQNLELSL